MNFREHEGFLHWPGKHVGDGALPGMVLVLMSGLVVMGQDSAGQCRGDGELPDWSAWF